MNPTERIELAKAYVALSNAHRLDLVLPMFAAEATYRSTYVGEFAGKPAIGRMMAEFFARFPDVYWEVSAYRERGANAVEFAFVMTATEAATGQAVRRQAVETLEFTDAG
ncbi:nuclear transport factor 2 family protein, partial [Arthrospira platensis SPKY1]|nr:nuclear transport factor 2 family protein [Arthrospira platensis SPKY1]